MPDSFRGWVDYLWYLPLYKTGGEWIRLHGLIIAICILVAGIWVSVLCGRFVKRAMMYFKPIPEHIAIVFSKLLIYILIFFVIIATVLFAGMPFSIVSVFGAVLLVGLSLGAKSTIYDYLSGLVLALEQPVRIHDCIEVGEHAGFVDEVRGRYTRVRRFDGIDILVPNSKFLEDEVINWTLSDSKLRGDFEVGVHYSSDVDKTMDILLHCMEEEGEVFTDPPPSVLFWEFGNSALVFRLFFWMRAENPLEIWSVASKLRRASFNGLKKAGITVAFPQRDIHLDTRQPLNVTIDHHSNTGSLEKNEKNEQKPDRTVTKNRNRQDSEQVAEPESSSDGDDAGDKE